MTPPDWLDELERLLGEATPGPWRAHAEPFGEPGWMALSAVSKPDDKTMRIEQFGSVTGESNARLFVAAVNALPDLIEIARAVQAILDRHDSDPAAARATAILVNWDEMQRLRAALTQPSSGRLGTEGAGASE